MTPRILRIGLVTEGPSERMVLEAILRGLCVEYELELQALHPPRILTQGLKLGIALGWPGVRTWCFRNGPELERLMQITPESPLHLLAIHADGSIANKLVPVPLPVCPPARPTADALRAVIAAEWLRRSPLPPFVVLAVPMQTTDTWVIAAHLGDAESICECELKTDQRLARLGSGFRFKDGQLKKSEAAYRPLAEAMGRAMHGVRTRCQEAERFCQEIETAARTATGS